MKSCVEIKPVNIQDPSALFLKKNESGIDLALLQELKEAKEKYKLSSWIGLLDIPETKNNERLTEYAESRRCLLAALRKIDQSTSGLATGIKIHLSLSHTKTHSAALAIFDNKNRLIGVGVDLEKKDREIKPEIKTKYIFDSEKSLGLSALELWTIKEASFKANSRINGGSLFKFEIQAFDSNRLEGVSGQGQPLAQLTSFQMYPHEDLLITIALASAY